MLKIRASEERGHNKISWLESRFTFSFDQYFDPEHVQFRSLRVLNEDVIAPGKGFPTHPHRDMEILTWVMEGALEHRDSLGGSGVIRPGELQHMTAGTGLTHSEFNHSAEDSVHMLQIWLLPERRGLKPEYEQLAFADQELRGKFMHVAGPDAPVTIHQDADLYVARLNKASEARHELKAGRQAWLQVAKGALSVATRNGNAQQYELKAGDGAEISNESEVRVTATSDAEVLLFDMA